MKVQERISRELFLRQLYLMHTKIKILSAFMMAVCNNSVFDLLRNSFLIPIRFNDKGVENPIFLTDENGKFLDESRTSYLGEKIQNVP